MKKFETVLKEAAETNKLHEIYDGMFHYITGKELSFGYGSDLFDPRKRKINKESDTEIDVKLNSDTLLANSTLIITIREKEIIWFLNIIPKFGSNKLIKLGKKTKVDRAQLDFEEINEKARKIINMIENVQIAESKLKTLTDKGL